VTGILPSADAKELETKRLPLHKIDKKEVYYSLSGEGGGSLSHFEHAALRKRLKGFGKNLDTW
jgi:hypothetical protein